MDNFIINMVILNTKIVVYKKRQDGSIMNKNGKMGKFIIHFICKNGDLNNT